MLFYVRRFGCQIKIQNKKLRLFLALKKNQAPQSLQSLSQQRTRERDGDRTMNEIKIRNGKLQNKWERKWEKHGKQWNEMRKKGLKWWTTNGGEGGAANAIHRIWNISTQTVNTHLSIYWVNRTYAMQAASSPSKCTCGFKIVVFMALQLFPVTEIFISELDTCATELDCFCWVAIENSVYWMREKKRSSIARHAIAVHEHSDWIYAYVAAVFVYNWIFIGNRIDIFHMKIIGMCWVIIWACNYRVHVCGWYASISWHLNLIRPP